VATDDEAAEEHVEEDPNMETLDGDNEGVSPLVE
jgi:hypothetical protein